MKKGILQILLLVVVIIGVSCKKTIEKAKTDAIVDAMVANKWVVLQYMEGATNVTAEFDGYEFQFNKDKTVVGANATVSRTGTWEGNTAAQTMSTNFAGATTPLIKLNGTWKSYYYDSNGFKFDQTINGVKMTLALKKK